LQDVSGHIRLQEAHTVKDAVMLDNYVGKIGGQVSTNATSTPPQFQQQTQLLSQLLIFYRLRSACLVPRGHAVRHSLEK